MVKFRFHRGGYEEAMKTVVEVQSLDDLKRLLAATYPGPWPLGDEGEITVKSYGFDARNGWDTHIVCVNGNAVGFTSGPLE